jgi:hypothetical protein
MKLIRYESGVLNHLQGLKGVPKFLGYFEDSGFEILKLEYLGNDLETILRLYGKVSQKVTNSNTPFLNHFLGLCSCGLPSDIRAETYP